MALPSWFRQSVRRIRPGVKTVRGASVPDWDDTESETITGCSVQPSGTTLSQDGRILGISESFTLYLPPGSDVKEGDRIVYGSDTYVVSGVPRPWVSPTGALDNMQVTIERWAG